IEGNANPNSLIESAAFGSNIIWTNTLNYSNNFGERHNLTVVIGSESISNYGRNLAGSRQGFFSTNFEYLTLNNGTSQVTNSSNANTNSLFSLFSRVDYSYNDKYMIGAVIRRDGSSVFGSKKRFGVFPSFSAGWRISEEDFIGNINWL